MVSKGDGATEIRMEGSKNDHKQIEKVTKDAHETGPTEGLQCLCNHTEFRNIDQSENDDTYHMIFLFASAKLLDHNVEVPDHLVVQKTSSISDSKGET